MKILSYNIHWIINIIFNSTIYFCLLIIFPSNLVIGLYHK